MSIQMKARITIYETDGQPWKVGEMTHLEIEGDAKSTKITIKVPGRKTLFTVDSKDLIEAIQRCAQ